jgi:ABC-2 type transport system ATP-binding protein
MLEVNGLTKTYGGVLAVRDVSFTAAPGQVIGFLGPNGSGKSTSLRVLTGLLRATRGTVRWNGVEIQDQLLDYQAQLGYVPEEPRLYAYLTAPEYLFPAARSSRASIAISSSSTSTPTATCRSRRSRKACGRRC